MHINAHCRLKIMCADLRFGFLRFSILKKCPHMHRELRKVDLVFALSVTQSLMQFHAIL